MRLVLLNCFFLLATLATIGQNDCQSPEITNTEGGGTYCPGEVITLSITGALNDAAEWQWSTGECGGDILENETGTSIEVEVTESVVYFVRGVGGCVEDGEDCAEIELILDDIPPIVQCPHDIVVSTAPGICAAVVDYQVPVASDNCQGDLTIELTEGLGSGATFSLGITTEEYLISDALGNTATCSFTITVEDTEDPQIICSDDIEVFNDPGQCGALVDYPLPVASDNCVDVEVTMTAGLGSGSFFPVGTTTETYLATDGAGNTSSCSINITVIDNELPVITLSQEKSNKWPPNHKAFTIDIDDYIESVTDNCPGVTIDDIIIDEVTSDEPNNGTGDGNTDDDIVIGTDCRQVDLLAERSGNGNGRVYTVHLAVMDTHDNIGTTSFRVEIAHDQGKKHQVVDDGPVYVVNGCDLESENESVNAVAGNTTEPELGNIQTLPNPFVQSLIVNFTPTTTDYVLIDLYDLSGRRIEQLYQGEVLADRDYSWNYQLGYLDKKLYILVIQGRQTFALSRVIKL